MIEELTNIGGCEVQCEQLFLLNFYISRLCGQVYYWPHHSLNVVMCSTENGKI